MDVGVDFGTVDDNELELEDILCVTFAYFRGGVRFRDGTETEDDDEADVETDNADEKLVEGSRAYGAHTGSSPRGEGSDGDCAADIAPTSDRLEDS